MGFALFHYTLFVMLVSVLASATCLSSYLVSRKRIMLFAFFGFLFYFFDVAWVFQGDFFTEDTAGLGAAYALVISLSLVVTGCGFLTSFWLLLCEYLGEARSVMKVAPAVVFVAGSLACLLLIPEGNVRSFWFFFMREAYLFWMLLFVAVWLVLTKSEDERGRLLRHRVLYIALWVLGLCVVLEDALVFLVPEPVFIGPRAYAPERNFSENVLMLACAFLACRDAVRSLSLRFERPPMHGGGRQEELIDANLLAYGRRYQLSERECEVLRYVLLGKDNQNIASSMHLALSTVKVHVHNILQKTGQSDRQALSRDFWKMA
ncbi:helix-turn-helix transcriptional regulator [Gordonibacter sp. An230]|uniref:helix-turn-helix transcriptional regulator n=1 Tax=Gordonibacter sp. An230 TaxID=1965592 RepID=UPI000B392B2C|nr:LuxR C-terminal-related transcriptional regulator [Gordonibacter sp. An230]OUO87997.1 helix-turn-helix transcriptional regulator [Gordonibacter sp. An230]